ncbi:twin-arginine translocase TatA/TatE family subunit [Paracoccus sediminilitoris]|uniref:twin-arginine translocase TatA/TatE family subunit n=1 Tax=Paracoccus sediminilitoris TaxID=2202419 RepID=UPI000DB99932|nr:twin-arginine translocase TatA/TatE family subunit [Paracoccus sediminilitoris]
MLNNIGLPGLLLIVVVALVLFGKGKISFVMGEVGSGLTAFKKGLREADLAESTSGSVASNLDTPSRTDKHSTESRT